MKPRVSFENLYFFEILEMFFFFFFAFRAARYSISKLWMEKGVSFSDYGLYKFRGRKISENS